MIRALRIAVVTIPAMVLAIIGYWFERRRRWTIAARIDRRIVLMIAWARGE